MSKSLSPVIRYLTLSFSSFIPNGYVTDELKKTVHQNHTLLVIDRCNDR